MPPASLFAYGTLRDPDVRRLVLGRAVPPEHALPADAPGCEVVFFPGRTYPALRRTPSASAEGTLVTGLSPIDLDLLDRFEGPEYVRGPIGLVVAGKAVTADVYWPAAALPPTLEPWRLGGLAGPV